MPASQFVPQVPESPSGPGGSAGPGREPSAAPADPGPVIRGPADVVAAVPYLLGHHPSQSLVVLSVRPGAALGVVCRIDLPDPAGGEAASADVVERLVGAAVADGADSALVLVYDEDPGAGGHGDGGDLVDAVVDGLRGRGVGVTDVLHVGPQRWRSRWCDDGRCCPPEGRPVAESRDRPVAARFVLDGRSPAPDRSSVEPPAAAAPVAARRAAAQAAARWRRRVAAGGSSELPVSDRFRLLDEWLGVLDRHGSSGELPSPAVVGRLAAAWSQDLRTRDACLVAVLPGAGPAPDSIVAGSRIDLSSVLADRSCAGAVGAAAPVLRHMAAHLSGPPAAAVLAVHAWLAWVSGQGAAAGDLASRASAAGSGHRLATLVLRALDHAVAPDWAAPAGPVTSSGAGS
ncbi:MAG: DUF4192 domain-containing protein [Kineosporiaceae bacterium]